MTRIIAGAARGRSLGVPSAGTRPTSDRAREGLFSTLTSLLGSLSGVAVLDLYAGSGAVGLEALSRGADRVTLVESEPRSVAVVRANTASLDLPGATVVHDQAERFVASQPLQSYDVVFLDPPYAMPGDELARVLERLSGRLLADAGLVIVERATRDAPWTWPDGIEPIKHRTYGEATLWYGRATSGTESEARSEGADERR